MMGRFDLSRLRQPMNCDGKRDCSGEQDLARTWRAESAHSGRFERGVANGTAPS